MTESPNGTEPMAAAVSSLKDAVGVLEAEEARLSRELSDVKGKRQAAAKALEALGGSTPRRRRGRPRKTDEQRAAEAAATTA